MSVTTPYRIRLDPKTRSQVDILFDELGITFSSAIVIFIKACIREGAIPFAIPQNSVKTEQKYVPYTVRIDSVIRKEAGALFKQLGLTFSGSVRLFLAECLTEQAIPFRIMSGKLPKEKGT